MKENNYVLRVMHSGTIRRGKNSRRPAGLYGRLLRTGAALCTVVQMEK